MFPNMSDVQIQQHIGYELVNETTFVKIYNTSQMSNGTVDGSFLRKDYSSDIVNISKWGNNINLKDFLFNGVVVKGKTIQNFGSQLNGMYRIRGNCAKLGGGCEFSIVFNTTISGQQVYVDFDPTINDDVVSYYRLNETVGSYNDSVETPGTANSTAIVVASRTAAGIIGGWNAPRFASNADLIRFAGNNHLDSVETSKDRSIFVVVNATTFGGNRIIFSYGNNAAGGASSIQLQATGSSTSLTLTTSDGTEDCVSLNASMTANEFHVVGFVYDNTTNVLDLYQDGNIVEECTDINLNTVLGAGLYIGAHQQDTTEIWQGVISAFYMRNSTMSYAEVRDLNTSWTIDGDFYPFTITAADLPPLFFDNYTNNSLPRFGEIVGMVINWSDDTNIGSIFADHNLTLFGVYQNITVTPTTKAINLTFNLTSILKYSNASSLNTSRIIVRANDSANQFNETEIIIFTAANTLPTINNNNTNFTTVSMSEFIKLWVNVSDVDGTLGFIAVGSNFTDSVVNVTLAILGNDANASFNFTNALKFSNADNLNTSYFRICVNDSSETTCGAQQFFTISNSIPTFDAQPSFVNLSAEHMFNVSASVRDLDGNDTLANVSIFTTSGTCTALSNGTVNADTAINFTFNCTGTAFVSTTITISANDTNLGAVVSTSFTNAFPNALPNVTSLSINNSPVSASQDANVSWFFTDLDNSTDTEENFTIRWYVNGAHIATGNDQRVLLSENYSTDDTVIVQLNISDSFETSVVVNTSSLTVGDSMLPLIVSGFGDPVSPNTDLTIDLFINVSDVGSEIDFVKVEVRDPNQVRINLSTTLNSGTNAAGEESRWVATFTVDLVGVHQIRAFVTDGSGNANRTLDGFFNFSATAGASTTTSSGGGGGGGGGSTTFVTIIENITAPFCGDNICQVAEGEDILRCPQDCSADLMLFSGFTDTLGKIPLAILILIVVGVAFLFLRGSFGKSLKRGNPFSRENRKFSKRKFFPEGSKEGPRLR